MHTPICLDKYEGLFRILVVRNRRIMVNNSEMVETVLSRTRVGSKLLDRLRTKKIINLSSVGESYSSTAVLLHTSITPIPVFAFTILLLSERPSLAPEDLEEIVASLKQYLEGKAESFCQINGMVTMMVLDGIFKYVESFRQSRMQELSDNCSIQEIFSF